jgi:phage regulator Rha-like protein
VYDIRRSDISNFSGVIFMEPNLLPQETIQSKILFLRGKRVILDQDLALLYEIENKMLKRAVKRNIDRFPEDFMFELTKDEYQSLRYQIGTLKRGEHSKYLPYAFTEHGILMLSSVLNSDRAIKVNIQIMRTFNKMREMLINYQEVRQKIEEMEQKYDYQFKVVFEAIRQLLEPPKKPEKKIGFQND